MKKQTESRRHQPMYWINNFLERNLQLFHVWYIVLHLHRAQTVPQAIEQVPNHQGYNFAYLPFVPNLKPHKSRKFKNLFPSIYLTPSYLSQTRVKNYLQ